jgi:cytochrome c551/c552
MVLDGAVDPSAEGAESPGQAAGFEMALGNWIEWCLEQTDCPFGGTPQEVAAQIATMLADLDENPLPASDGRLVGGDTFASGITSALYSPDTWPDLSELFLGYLNGDVDPAIALADWYNGRNDDGSARPRPAGTAAAASAAAPSASGSRDVQTVLAAYGCTGCHAVDRKLVGPSFKEVANRFGSETGGSERVARRIREGGAGAWGSIPMPPHPAINDDELRALVTWVFAQR